MGGLPGVIIPVSGLSDILEQEDLMRTLSQNEMEQVSGGFGLLAAIGIDLKPLLNLGIGVSIKASPACAPQPCAPRHGHC